MIKITREKKKISKKYKIPFLGSILSFVSVGKIMLFIDAVQSASKACYSALDSRLPFARLNMSKCTKAHRGEGAS